MAIVTETRIPATPETTTQYATTHRDFQPVSEPNTVREDSQFTTEDTGAYKAIMTLLEDELRWPLKGLVDIAKKLADTDSQAQAAYDWLMEFMSYVDDTKVFLIENGGDDFIALRDMYFLENYLCSVADTAEDIHALIPNLTGFTKAEKKEFREDVRDIERIINKRLAHLRDSFPSVF